MNIIESIASPNDMIYVPKEKSKIVYPEKSTPSGLGFALARYPKENKHHDIKVDLSTSFKARELNLEQEMHTVVHDALSIAEKSLDNFLMLANHLDGEILQMALNKSKHKDIFKKLIVEKGCVEKKRDEPKEEVEEVNPIKYLEARYTPTYRLFHANEKYSVEVVLDDMSFSGKKFKNPNEAKFDAARKAMNYIKKNHW
jgi:dynactin complex subunit